ncbi:unnamed protein product (macronuclear) [Paramecium tetraurelia]|uniref:Cytochrome b5 heme-binding domain-containing protein n=1 Tax=Paramecium tetraurelia TaxID=5888 RepID=A0C5Z1_PARTE|nr:uncharacterized protein GSPATT00035337001 [Paramecium tetraurelia]CAK66208.1 unnamed protein product [Paramecium tetraurelia]|eukprot:XP_001433605.1 hypothetical protein (macronuclear) [Paramecium tetraurelia strain d4-2]
MGDEVEIETLDEVVTFILNDLKQQYHTDLLTLRDQENQYYEIDQIVEFKRPHTFITIPQRHDVKTLAKNEVRGNRNIYSIKNDTILLQKYKETCKVETVNYRLEDIKKANKKYVDTLVGIFDEMVIQPKKRNSLKNEVPSPIQFQDQPESPKFGYSPKNSVSPSWIQRKSLSDSSKKNDLKQCTIDEVAKHNTINSAWIVINSKVYDVTKYLNKHPGGKEELMKGVGTDGTALFMQNHPWVNAHYLLEQFQVGFLINHK